jgi:hypothetical protein
MSVRSTITSQFQQVAQEHQRTLSFAVIVARLEDLLGIDPFNAADVLEFPVTFGDFVRLYEDFRK